MHFSLLSAGLSRTRLRTVLPFPEAFPEIPSLKRAGMVKEVIFSASSVPSGTRLEYGVEGSEA